MLLSVVKKVAGRTVTKHERQRQLLRQRGYLLIFPTSANDAAALQPVNLSAHRVLHQRASPLP
jgi:hypothetical protein